MIDLPDKFLIKTFGCQMNKHDSEKMAGLLVEAGFVPTDNLKEADIVIFNTCCVRKHAEERLFGNVNSLGTPKKEKPKLIIAVGGCLSQKYREGVLKKCSHVDIVFGTHNIANLVNLIKKAKEGNLPVVEILEEPFKPPTVLPTLREKNWHAWVTIITGCNNFCAYCIVPYVRGKEISRPIEEIINEIEEFAREGIIEVTLLGQNVNSYGKDLYGKSQFAKLLREIDQIEGIKRIKFATSHPRDFSDEIIEAISGCQKVCEHVHLPVQAGSDRILKLMKRGYTKEEYLKIVEKLCQQIPKVSITTDIMVGFPSETDEDFNETLDVVKKACFDQAFTFIYSPRPDTFAFKMEDRVPTEVKLKRFKQLIDLQTNNSLKQNIKLIGQIEEVFVEGTSKKNPSMLSGRTRTNKIVNFSGTNELINRFVKVRIKEAHPFHLIGELIKNEKRTSGSCHCPKSS